MNLESCSKESGDVNKRNQSGDDFKFSNHTVSEDACVFEGSSCLETKVIRKHINVVDKAKINILFNGNLSPTKKISLSKSKLALSNGKLGNSEKNRSRENIHCFMIDSSLGAASHKVYKV